MILLFSIYSVNALIISEIESNPDGKDSRNEWIEFFSGTEIEGEYRIVNNDDDELHIALNFVGYKIYTFNGQWLDNSNEKVYLYDEDDKLIDSTNLFDDEEDSPNTWQKCEDTWVFQNQTKEVKNCVVEEEKEEESYEEEVNEDSYQRENEGKDEEPEEVAEEEIIEPEKSDVLTGSIIKLDSKDIKSESNKEGIDKNRYATFGLGVIAILLLFLFVSQRYKHSKKNEFR